MNIKITKYLITTLITSLILSLYWVTTYASEQKLSPTTKIIIKHIEEHKINNDLEMSRKMNETKDNISILSKEDILNQFKTETIQKGEETLKYLSSEEVINYNGLIEQSQSKEEIDNIFNKFLELNNQKAEQQKKKEENKKPALETKKEAISNYRSSVVLSNGNTPGEIGTYAAIKMEEATGVSRTIWEQIIARESNGNPNAVNPSGAAGLFQTMPFWGPTDTVEAQINTALRAYNEALRYFGNGLQPWGF